MILLNKTDCGSAIKGTGTLGCKVDINYLTQFFLLEKGVEFDLTTDTLDQTKVDELIQNGQLVILPEHDSFTSEGGDAVYEELPSGAKLFVRNGLYEFLPLYAKGICVSNALASMSAKNWSLWMLDFDDAGDSRVWGERTTNDKFKGFDCFLTNAENRQFNDGNVSTKTPFRIQLSTKGTQAMRSRVAYLSSDQSIDFANLDGINDVELEATSLTAADFRVKATIGCDGSTTISSVTDTTNWRIIDTSDSSVQAGYTVNYAGGEYTIGSLAAGTYTVEFYDETNSREIIVSGGVYYDSDTITVTLT